MSGIVKGLGFSAVALACYFAVVSGVVLRNSGAFGDGVSDNGGRAFFEEAIPAVAKTWDQQALLDRATPELRSRLTPARMERLFARLTPLGSLVSFEPPDRQTLAIHGDETQAAIYDAKAKFQNGDALIDVSLSRRDGRWMIARFDAQRQDSATADRP